MGYSDTSKIPRGLSISEASEINTLHGPMKAFVSDKLRVHVTDADSAKAQREDRTVPSHSNADAFTADHPEVRG